MGLVRGRPDQYGIHTYPGQLASRIQMANGRDAASSRLEDRDVQDIFWIGLMLAFLAATLGYVALCERA